jgi:hypothetical protein
MERFFHEQEAAPNPNRILFDEGARLYFLRTNWLAFLIIQNFIRDADLLHFYREYFRRWEVMFRGMPQLKLRIT